MKHHATVLLIAALLGVISTTHAQLTVRTDAYGSKPGYIDDATLVVEPHGAYVEQSLYLTYADHHQFPSSLVEIVHRFELPANAVVNDLWLWIGDSVMQAIMLDTWKARSIYDSIVSKKRDPALLTKNGSTYELHVYPLESGKFRKIKLNFIVPTRWMGDSGVAELPLRMLKGNNAQRKPLRVLFRETEAIWGMPAIPELLQQAFGPPRDTSGFSYRSTQIDDIASLSSLTLVFSTGFVQGSFATTSDVPNDATYFQFGFKPGQLFGLRVDSTSRHLLLALDLSGRNNKSFSTLMPRVKQLLRSAAKPQDSINVMIAGAGKVDVLAPTWRIASSDSMNGMIDRFVTSAWGVDVAKKTLPRVLYADSYASICWQFPGYDSLMTFKNYTTLLGALNDSQGADVIAAYKHGYEDAAGTQVDLNQILSKADAFFAGGGRLLTYFDYNRVGKELVASHYLPGLTTTRRPDGSATLYRNPQGNIGMYFPESLVHYGFDYLRYDPNPNIAVELQDKDGKPVVISKRIGNGLLVVSAVWSFRDDGALRGLLGVPLLGLSNATKDQQLTGLLGEIRSRYNQSAFERILLLSNADSLFTIGEARGWASSYLGGFGNAHPTISTVNLLEGMGYPPGYVTDQQVQYYGSGLLLRSIADAAQGMHFETHIDNWPFITTALNAYSNPVAESLNVSVSVGGGSGHLNELREVDPLPRDANKPRFFIGSTSITDSIRITIVSRFAGAVGEHVASVSIPSSHDTAGNRAFLPSMLGNERLRDLLNQSPRDTAAIVAMAMRYRLLCDFTALIALEPNDTLHFLKDPLDESGITGVQTTENAEADSLMLLAYPNPFNSQTRIVATIAKRALVSIEVYNILGQLVRALVTEEMAEGRRSYQWDGTDRFDQKVSSGVYFVRLIAKDLTTGITRYRIAQLLVLK